MRNFFRSAVPLLSCVFALFLCSWTTPFSTTDSYEVIVKEFALEHDFESMNAAQFDVVVGEAMNRIGIVAPMKAISNCAFLRDAAQLLAELCEETGSPYHCARADYYDDLVRLNCNRPPGGGGGGPSGPGGPGCSPC